MANRPLKEDIIDCFYNKKMTQKDTAKKFGVSRSAIYRLQKKFQLEPLIEWQIRYPSFLSQIQKEVLYGSILGDDCLYKFDTANYSRLMVCHSTSNKDYIQLKYNIWENFVYGKEKGIKTRIRDKGTRMVFETGGHPEFEKVRKEVYIGTVKSISLLFLKNLTPISLAFWFMDDGSRCKNRGLAIHTNCFSLDEVQLICDWFWNTEKIICKPQKRAEKQYVVFFSNKTSEKFALTILPYVHPSMRYKLKGVFIENPQRLNAVPFLSTLLVPHKNGTSEDKV